jgi:tetratricopeptide (TPR) repeat protein
MKTKIFAIMVTFFSLLFFSLTYGEEENPEDFHPLIIEGKKTVERGVDLWDLKTLMNARGIFEKILTVQEKDYLSHYYLACADYRICIMYINQKEDNLASDYLEEGIKHLEESIELNSNFSESYALLASLLGFKIGLKWYLGITLGPKVGSYFERALQIDSLNPRTYLLLGISKYNTPKMFGGGMDKAESNLIKAIQLYGINSPPDSLLPTWGHEEAYAWLGKVYMEKKEYEKAQIQFEKAMEIKPGYGWVKYQLLNELNEKIKKDKKK